VQPAIAGGAALTHNPAMDKRVVAATACAGKAAGALLLLATTSCAFLEIGSDTSWSPGSAGPEAMLRRFPAPPPRPDLSRVPAAEVARQEVRPDTGVLAADMHRVSAGETVYSIARQRDVDVYALITVNGLTPPFTLFDGQHLRLPGGAVAQLPQVTAPASQAKLSAGDPTVWRPAPKPLGGDAEQPAVPGGRDLVASPHAPEMPPPQEPVQGLGFAWPAEGRIVSAFGPKGGGLYNDGINIAAPAGTPVRAAEAGVIAYAGNELRGFGNMLLIKHTGGWITTYAHNQELLVKRGERVRRGQVIARVGSSGAVDQPQLHFEIRKGKRAVDPLQQLPRPSAAARNRVAG
jgi:murein DD-endopeptidase MepM/ murein hydrolase activator NlpD